jgi:hypothetical protein
MFVFITAVRHPATSKNYAKVQELPDLTTKSILAQTNQDFMLVVVCNEKPTISNYDTNKLHYHLVDFAPPVFDRKMNTDVKNKDYRIFMRDKDTRLTSGLLYTLKFEPDYVFLLDCDDWININLGQDLITSPPYPVWYVDHGHVVDYQTKEHKRKHGMVRYSGTAFAFQTEYLLKLANFQSELDESSSQQQLIEASSALFIEHIMGNHAIGYFHFSKLGSVPRPFPMHTICWVTDTGENVSRSTGGKFGKPNNKQFCRTFGLEDTFINPSKQSIFAHIREKMGEIKSALSWRKSRANGRLYY